MRDSCQARDDYAEGYSVGQADTGGVGWVGVSATAVGSAVLGW